MAKKSDKFDGPENASFKIVEDERKYDVATGYALLSGGDVPPVIRGEDVETL